MAHRLMTILAATSLSIHAWPSQAQFMNFTPLQSLNRCNDEHLLSHEDPGAPAPIVAALASGGGAIVFRVCTDEYSPQGYSGKENVHYHLRALSSHRNGICEAKETEVFVAGPDDVVKIERSQGSAALTLRNLTTKPPAAWTAVGYAPRYRFAAFVTDGDCPPVDDAQYILTSNVPDATLKQLQLFWRQATRTPEAFNQALGSVPYAFFDYLPWIRKGQQALLDEFRQRVFEGKAPQHNIDCTGATCRVSFGDQYRWIEFAVEPGGVRPVGWGGYLIA